MVSKERIEELKKIFTEDFGEELTDQEAHDAAFNLVGFYDTLMQCAFDDIQAYMQTGELSHDEGYSKWIISEAERIKKQFGDKVHESSQTG